MSRHGMSNHYRAINNPALEFKTLKTNFQPDLVLSEREDIE